MPAPRTPIKSPDWAIRAPAPLVGTVVALDLAVVVGMTAAVEVVFVVVGRAMVVLA